MCVLVYADELKGQLEKCRITRGLAGKSAKCRVQQCLCPTGLTKGVNSEETRLAEREAELKTGIEQEKKRFVDHC